MSRVFWVRHGPTHARAMVGWTDLPADLSDHAQIARLNDYLPNSALVISSDLIRASATADAITDTRERLPHDPDLREINFGDWEMRGFAEVEVEDPTRIRAYWETPGDVRPPNGESWHEVSARIDAAIAKVIAAHPERDIIAVAHFGAILTQVQQALQIEAYEAFSHKIDNLSVTELRLESSTWQIGKINHLP